MSDERYFRFSDQVLIAPMISVLLIWAVFWFEIRFQVNLNDYGIYPRTFSGLKGVLFGPFLHGSLEHLYNNSLPLIILMASLFYFYKEVSLRVVFFGILFSGLLTWTIGRPSFHIGASGLIYVLASFIFFKGIFTKHYRLVALSMLVVFAYGGMLWYIFPIKEGISWEGHLSGFATGLLLAIFLKTKVPEPRKYAWERDDFKEEEDEFLRHFDEEGNFIETPVEKQEERGSELKISYHYKRNKKDRSED